MNFHRLIFSFIFLFAVQTSNAQFTATIKATTDKKSILIGEPLQLTIEAKLSLDVVISFVTIDTIGHFEFLDKPVIDTLNEDGGITIRGVYKLTSFDSGHWVIPSFVLFPSVKTDSIHVEVMFSDFDPRQDYHDIKDIIEVAPPKKKQWWWFIAGGALSLAAVVIYILRKKKHAPVVLQKIEIDPYKEAMEQLEKLQKENLEAKKYHSRLIDIFRLYGFRKKRILSLQKTTADLVLQLKDIGLPKEQFDKLSQSLRLSDFVKFAKYVPTQEDDKKVFEDILNTIKIIEQSGS
ncbi:MAG TPA: hypothetical protein VN451_03290 [Chitinophagaceae bacterium]|nr:hypothetical protein [Chitinophagaceae bacterium]